MFVIFILFVHFVIFILFVLTLVFSMAASYENVEFSFVVLSSKKRYYRFFGKNSVSRKLVSGLKY